MANNLSATKNTESIELINKLLTDALCPITLEIADQSHLHANHAEAQANGGGHYSVQIVSDKFIGKPMIERHRMVYDALNSIMKSRVHAIQISALTPP